MAAQSDEAGLVAAWSALAGQTAAPGWSTIPLGSLGGRIRAGVQHPGNAEALLVGFGKIERPQPAHLPRAQGFSVTGLEPGTDPGRPWWFALCREPAGSRDMFMRMATDVVRTLAAAQGASENALFQVFISRIRAWQNFMQRPEDGILGLAEQIGLIGELIVLEQLLDAVPDALMAVEAWEGPLDGVQDFLVGHGAIEVKATTSSNGFPAKISSLEQLDQTVRNPVILAAVRLTLQPAGLSLPGWIDQLRTRLGQGSALALFENRLLHARFLDAHRDNYGASFEHQGTRLLGLGHDFPGLVRSDVSPTVLSATYEIDLDLVPARTMSWSQVMYRVGVS